MLSLLPHELEGLLMTLPPERTPFIWGPPGIGKSAIVRAAADALGLPCVTLLGTQIAPEDLIGVPRIRALENGSAATEFCPPRAILRDAPYLLFIDELNSAIADVQKAFYSLILDRRLGDYELPASSRVVGAGNRLEDRALVRPMATALSNRMIHVTLETNGDAWLAWAARSGIHPLVLSFVRARPDRLVETPPTDATPAYPTPRAWHMLSDAIKTVKSSLWPAIAAGSVGDRAGAEFSAYARRALDAPSLDDLAAGRAEVPKDPELLYFLGASALARLSLGAAEDGVVAARAVALLGGVSREVAVWCVDAALAAREGASTAEPGPRKDAPAREAFEAHLRSEGASVLVDALRLGRFARET